MTSTCIRSSFDSSFMTPPGTSDGSSAESTFWNNDSDSTSKYICLDMDAITPEKTPMSICAGCRLEICDRYILKVNPNLEFHAHCLKCFECGCQLDENQTAFIKNGQTYCRNDYMRLFQTRCARCAGCFDKSDLVMRAASYTFHMPCFCCVACEKRLQTGEEFRIRNGRLYCRADCECGNLPDTSGGSSDFKMLLTSTSNNNNSFDDDSWEDRSTLTSLDNHSPPLSPKSECGFQLQSSSHHNQISGSSSNTSTGKKKKDKQTTRVRTVLNETQLKILKECYSVNSRPDALLKERLVEMTGLNARVIRVWFQNKRCKDKKRQQQMHETRINSEREEVLNRVRVSGVGPLMVSAPSQHIDNTLGGPIDITHYTQWGSANPVAPNNEPTSANPVVEFPPNPMIFPYAPNNEDLFPPVD
ncbi:unnamed protein product [Caenorhabditis angaria]|uniref:Uncharacterized protein n=1 Tax=Caenorhabditis angaria TaxID=860376 RepID=A0A9P1I766_9PELO|nr:unnamed protein product [Caenorhabditis angaria]